MSESALKAIQFLRFGVLIGCCLVLGTFADAMATPQTTDCRGYNCIAANKNNEVFENKLRELLSVFSDDVKPPCKETNMLARRKYFTEQGWSEYQKYVAVMRQHLRAMKGRDDDTFYFSWVDGTQNYTHRYDEYSGFAAIGRVNYSSGCDEVVPGVGMFTINIAFEPQRPLAPDNVLIDSWRVQPYFADR